MYGAHVAKLKVGNIYYPCLG